MPEHSPKYMFGSNQSVSMDDLVPMEVLVRLSRNEEEFEALKLDLEQNGQKIPVKTRPHPNATLRSHGKLELLDGMGRYLALSDLGRSEIRADVEDLTDEEAYKMAFTLNINRENLNSLSIANWIEFLKRKFNMTNTDICTLTGRKKAWVSRHLAMIQTHEEIKSLQQTLGMDYTAEPNITERQSRAFRAASEPLKLEFVRQLAYGEEPPSAREMERASTAEYTPEQVLARYVGRPGIDDEFLEYMLQEDAGLTLAQAKERVRDFRIPKRSSSGAKLSQKANVWTKLSQYYPTEILDVVGNLTGSENFDTLIKYCRRYSQKLYLRAPESLRQAVMEEWMS
jgi:ParB/RepB/Spo0J family partition protein